MTTSLQQSTKEAILQYLLRENKASAQSIADVIGISLQATRRHLKDLQQQGFMEIETVQAKTGRPQYLYFLSRRGRDRFPQNYGEFALSFLDTLTETVGEKEVSKILEKQWQKKADHYRRYMTGDTLKQKIEQLVKMRQEEGYMAEVFMWEEKPNHFFISEHNCAISEVAESYPQVCHHELEMFASLFQHCTVERTNWIHHGEHRCGYLIRKDNE